MGIKKKLKTTFTRKTNSRKEKRKEEKKRNKALHGSDVSLTMKDIYDQLCQEHQTGKQSPVPCSETRLPVIHPNAKTEEVETSELQIIPSHTVGVAPKRPRTARILTCPGNLPAPTRTQTRMQFRDDESDADTISLCSTESGISVTSVYKGEVSRTTIVAPFTPPLGIRRKVYTMPRTEALYRVRFDNDLEVIDLEDYNDADIVNEVIPLPRAPSPEDLHRMYRILLTSPIKNVGIIDLKPTASSLSLMSSDTTFDWPEKENHEIPYVEHAQIPDIGYGFQEQNAKNVVGRLNQFKADRETQKSQPVKLPSIVNNTHSRAVSRASTSSSVYSTHQSRTCSARPGSSVSVTSNGQKAQDYLDNLKEHKTTWQSEDRINSKGEKRIRRKLLDGAYPNCTVKEDKLSTLMRLAWKGKHQKLKKYLQDPSKHGKVNRTDKFGRTALHFAASWADYRMLKILLDIRGINLNIKDKHDKTALFKAIDMKSLACVRLLVQAGAIARVTCRDERNAIEYAITEYGDEAFEIIEYLYNGRGIRDTDMGSNRMSLLHQAVVTKKHVTNVKVIRMILEPGMVDVDAVEADKRTPLILAAQAQRPDLLLTLLEHGADPNHYDNFMKNAIRYTEEGSECFKILQGCRDSKRTGKRTFKYRPTGQLAPIQAVNIHSSNANRSGSTPSEQSNKKAVPFNLNPKTEDPEYRKHITNLFLASKFKEPKKEDLYYDPESL
ncbi:uncharacterized protein [Clytia hemisphaerica]|uniref:Uncharacterized protein n=1 Tax=Clytia hemisphaerica TaxID=252671 RepID=A0A7M5VF03_9CNID